MRTRYKYKKLKLAWLKSLLLIVLSLPTSGVSASQFTELLNHLSQGGYVIYIRHAATRHDDADHENLKLDDCSTQRNLTGEGKDYAQRLRTFFETLSIPYAQVISSPFCRTRDTAQLAFDNVIVQDFLFFSAGLNQQDRSRLSQKLRGYLNTKPPSGRNNIVVGHTSNLLEAVGRWPEVEGEMHIFLPQGGVMPRHIGTIKPDQINRWFVSR